MDIQQAPAVHDFGPGRRTRGVDYSITSFDKTPGWWPAPLSRLLHP
ncbi:hypothetical protein [Streptomyces sp. BE133]|nr:hypothetical protein [Streptomyces sp. BE133]MEE1812693.1 hypothetical protein [Streptomyces sp. BE133]